MIPGEDYRKQVLEALTSGFSKHVDAHFEQRLERLARQAEKVASRAKLDPEEVTKLKTEFTALIGTGIGYRASPKAVERAVGLFVDRTFELSYDLAMKALRSREPGANGDISSLFSSGMDVLTRVLEGGSTVTVETRALPSQTSPRQERRAAENTSLDSYIPKERRVTDDAYVGFTVQEIQREFRYESEKNAAAHIRKLRKDRSILRAIGKDDQGMRYDFQGAAYLFIRAKNPDKSATKYTRKEALSTIAEVLKLEGVQEKFIEEDARGVLEKLEALDKKLKDDDGKYTGFRLCRSFVVAARAHYGLDK